MPRVLELAPTVLAPPELLAVQMLLLYAPHEPEICCHVLPVACCSAIATPDEPEVCGHVLPRSATAVLAPPELATLASPELAPCFVPDGCGGYSGW